MKNNNAKDAKGGNTVRLKITPLGFTQLGQGA
jgi:hypothetical protein